MRATLFQRTADWMYKKAFGGPGTAEGRLRAVMGGDTLPVRTTDHYRESQQYKGWVYCAVAAIADQWASATPSVLGPPTEGGGDVQKSDTDVTDAQIRSRPLDPNHPAYRLLLYPNPFHSAAVFRYCASLQLNLTGTCYVWTLRNEGGYPIERYVVPTAFLEPVGESKEAPQGGFRIRAVPDINYQGFYQGAMSSLLASTQTIPREQFQVIMRPGPLNTTEGVSPITAGANWIDIAAKLDATLFNTCVNTIRPGLLITEDGKVTTGKADRERVKAQLEEIYSGAERAGANLFLPSGMKAEKWPFKPEELGYGESYPLVRDAVFALFRTPPVAAGVMSANSYAEYYAAMTQFIELTIQPQLDLFGDQESIYLTKLYKEDILVVYNARVMDDPDQKRSKFELLARCGALTINELRGAYDMVKVPDGDKLIEIKSQQSSKDTPVQVKA